MRVLFLYKYLTLGGVETVLRTRLEMLADLGVHSEAWFLNDYGGSSSFADCHDRVRIGSPLACVRYFARGGFDLLCSIDTQEVFPAFARYRGPGQLVVEAHTAYPKNLEYLSSLGGVTPAAVWVPSRYHRHVVRAHVGGGLVIRVVPNPLHSSFLAAPDRRAEPPRRPILAWVGRLDDLKNWEDLLAVCSELSGQGRDFRLWLVGKPVSAGERSRFLATARASGALGRMRWFHSLPHTAMPAFFDIVRGSGGVALTTSHAESFGMTVAEAMARACAVVVPGGKACDELVMDGVDGFRYPPGSPAAAAERVEAFFSDRELRRVCGETARQKVTRLHAPERVLAILASELRAVVEGAPFVLDVPVALAERALRRSAASSGA